MLIYYYFVNGDVAQLARASGSYPGGREFESLRRYQINNYSDKLFEFLYALVRIIVILRLILFCKSMI